MADPTFDIRICAPLEEGELFAFYQRNHICEEGYGQKLSEAPLKHEGVWVTAHCDDELVGFARALHDGLQADIMEIDL
ncbi:MAG: hypothetical protein GY851_31130, partial [bacterium]|nr:hypothetical protein [bacterium]